MRERKKPTLLKALHPVSVAHIAAGSLHNAVIADEGAVHTWGCNDDGALGRADDEWLPAPVDGPLGREHRPGDDATRVVQVQCGSSHTVALTASGAVYAWGTYRDANGVMGFTSTVDTATTPTLLPIAERVVMIAAGEHHDLALTEKGNVLQWGDVGHGQRAMDRHKKTKLQPTPVIIKRRGGGGGEGGGVVRFEQVFAGGASSFAVTADGAVYSWGPNNYSQTGHTQQKQEQAEDSKANADDAAAAPHPPPPTDAATTEGETMDEGEAKDAVAAVEEPKPKRRRKTAATPSLFVSIPTLIPSLPPIRKVAAAIHHTLFLTTSHAVLAVGKNVDGRLGVGHQGEVDAPISTGPAEVMDVGVGEAHSLLVVGRGEEGGSLWTCGMGDLLQLGHGVEEDVKEWERVESQQLDKEDRRVLQAVGGSQHSLILAVKRLGSLGLTEEEEKKVAQ